MLSSLNVKFVCTVNIAVSYALYNAKSITLPFGSTYHCSTVRLCSSSIFTVVKNIYK